MSGIEEAVETAAKYLAAEKKAKARAALTAQAERCRQEQEADRRRRANIIEETK